MLSHTTPDRAIHSGNYYVVKDTQMLFDEPHKKASRRRGHGGPKDEVISTPSHVASFSLARERDSVLGQQKRSVSFAPPKDTSNIDSSLCDRPFERNVPAFAHGGNTSSFSNFSDTAALLSVRQRPPVHSAPQRIDALNGAPLEQQSWYIEGLLRRIIELEGDNDLLRLALLEGSERRTRQQFFSGSSFRSGVSSFTMQLQQQQQQHQQSEVLLRISDMERDAKRHFQEELEKLEKRHLSEMRTCQETTKGERYETILSQAERHRWKEQVRRSVEEIALLRLEGERRPIADMGVSWHKDRTTDLSVDRHVAYLEEQVAHWKKEAEREREQGKQYRQDALKELQRMHAVYQRALGTVESTTGSGSGMTVARREVVTPDGKMQRMPIELEDEKHGGEAIVTLVEASTVSSEAKEFFSAAYASSNTPLGDKRDVVCATSTGAVVPEKSRIFDSLPGIWSRSNRSYHSDVYMRRESVDTDDSLQSV